MQNNNFLGSKKFRMCNDKEYITDEGFASDVEGDVAMGEKMMDGRGAQKITEMEMLEYIQRNMENRDDIIEMVYNLLIGYLEN